MQLEIWLRERNMETNAFAKKIGCSRKTIWKVKEGLKVMPYISKRIVKETRGLVNPVVTTDRGRPRKGLVVRLKEGVEKSNHQRSSKVVANISTIG